VSETAVRHPQYLDDEGGGERCYLRYDFALSEGEAKKRIENMGFDWDWRLLSECDVVWMRPSDHERHGEDWYDEVPEGTDGAVRYWRFRW